jgi:hypothetical protein
MAWANRRHEGCFSCSRSLNKSLKPFQDPGGCRELRFINGSFTTVATTDDFFLTDKSDGGATNTLGGFFPDEVVEFANQMINKSIFFLLEPQVSPATDVTIDMS